MSVVYIKFPKTSNYLPVEKKCDTLACSDTPQTYIFLENYRQCGTKK